MATEVSLQRAPGPKSVFGGNSPCGNASLAVLPEFTIGRLNLWGLRSLRGKERR